MMSPEEIRIFANEVASSLGYALHQTYEHYQGNWWLFTSGKPKRKLTNAELEWHIDRRHKPFVEDGVDKNDPRWWDDPCES